MEAQQAVSTETIRVAALYVTIIIAIIATSVTIVATVAFYKARDGQAAAFSNLVQQGALQTITVMSIIAASCFLAIIGKISPEGIISLLSGIAGYVLGGYAARARNHKNDSEISN